MLQNSYFVQMGEGLGASGLQEGNPPPSVKSAGSKIPWASSMDGCTGLFW